MFTHYKIRTPQPHLIQIPLQIFFNSFFWGLGLPSQKVNYNLF